MCCDGGQAIAGTEQQVLFHCQAGMDNVILPHNPRLSLLTGGLIAEETLGQQ